MAEDASRSTSEDGRWFEPDTATIGAARRFVARFVPPGTDVADDAALLVTELAANAVLHARTEYRVSVHAEPGTVRVSVTDHAAALPVLRAPAPSSAEGGRGLAIVAALAQRWGVDSVPDNGKTTWFELDTGAMP